MDAPVRVAMSATTAQVGRLSEEESVSAAPPAPVATLPRAPSARLTALHPAFAPLQESGVATRPTLAVAPVTPVAGADNPELSSSVMNRFLGLARHEVAAASEAKLNPDETRRLRNLLGTSARLDPKTVAPSRDDQMLLQRLLNEALGSALTPPLVVDGEIGGKVRAALELYRRRRGFPVVANGPVVDRAMLTQLGRDALAARATPNARVPAASADATPAVRSVTGMLDLLSREDPVRYVALLRGVGITNVTGRLTDADLRRVVDAGSRDGQRIVFDDDTATRLQLSQPGFGAPLAWNHEAARIVAAAFTGDLNPNRGVEDLGRYRGWAARADYAGRVLPRVTEIDALVESNYNPRLVSSARARGLHQLTKDVTDRYGGLDPFNPVLNIGMARRELARVYDEQLNRLRGIDDGYASRYPDEASLPQRDSDRIDGAVWRMAWAANNAGPRRLLRYQGVPPFDETQRHVMLLGWYNATLPSEREVPAEAMLPSLRPQSSGPQGPGDYGVKTVTKEF